MFLSWLLPISIWHEILVICCRFCLYLLLKTSWGPIINFVPFKFPVACFNLENNIVLELWTHLLKRWNQKTFFLLTDWYSALQLVLINVAFFGTGNMASVASFEISSVYRFITIFNVSCDVVFLKYSCWHQWMYLDCVKGIVQIVFKLLWQSTTAFLQHEKSF